MENVVSVSIKAVMANPDLMTGDNINALTGGHGGLTIATACAANCIATDILKGKDIMIKARNHPEIEADQVLRESIEIAKKAGAFAANAALLSASLLYFAGANARIGCPGGNRKLGASARMIAGAEKGGVLLIPAGKSTNKITAFPAVHAIYHAAMEGNLTSVKGEELPTLGPMYGHGPLAQDYVFPEICKNAARIGTEAMVKAQSGVGMKPNMIVSAILGTAATMEILHPDAELEVQQDGKWIMTDTSEMTGRFAANAINLPGKLHFRGTGEEMDSARLVGDLGLIFKDIGIPSVVGMLQFAEILASVEELGNFGAGVSGGPLCGPMPHQIGADCVIALRVLSQTKSPSKAMEAVRVNKEKFLDPETAMIAANTVARKAHSFYPGPVTEAIVEATEKVTLDAVESRVQQSYELLKTGHNISDVVKGFEDARKKKVETSASAMFSSMLGKDVQINILKMKTGARLPPNLTEYYGFDLDADVEVTIDKQKMLLRGLSQNIIPDMVIRGNNEYSNVLPLAAVPVIELMLSAHTIVNITAPCAVACALKIADPESAAYEAEKAAYITAAIPGTRSRARKVGELALQMINKM